MKRQTIVSAFALVGTLTLTSMLLPYTDPRFGGLQDFERHDSLTAKTFSALRAER